MSNSWTSYCFRSNARQGSPFGPRDCSPAYPAVINEVEIADRLIHGFACLAVKSLPNRVDRYTAGVKESYRRIDCCFRL